MALFLSTFINKIDAKGRVSVPAQFRGALNNQIVVYESFINDCFEGCDIGRIAKLSESIDALDPFSEERDAFAATILGGAMQLAIDGDGRVILPENLIKKSGIKERALFVGKGPTFEIWDPKKYEDYIEIARQKAKEKRSSLKLNQSKDA